MSPRPAIRITGRWLANGNIHGRLLIKRNGVFTVCGVIQLRREEWITMAALAVGHGIEIQTERGEPVPMEGADYDYRAMDPR